MCGNSRQRALNSDISGVSGGAADYGLASALSIVVFVVVGAISALAFRQTRKLEEFA